MARRPPSRGRRLSGRRSACLHSRPDRLRRGFREQQWRRRQVTGEALSGEAVSIPGDYAGAPAIVLVAPSKESQADADKWIVALRPRKDVVFVETPVLGSLITRMMQGFINGKMRGGEPRDMWPRIVPMYKDGDKLGEFFGDHGATLTYVVVIDGDGVIRAFSTSGFSDAALADALAAYDELK